MYKIIMGIEIVKKEDIFEIDGGRERALYEIVSSQGIHAFKSNL